jgi:hypothetical protein
MLAGGDSARGVERRHRLRCGGSMGQWDGRLICTARYAVSGQCPCPSSYANSTSP